MAMWGCCAGFTGLGRANPYAKKDPAPVWKQGHIFSKEPRLIY